MLYKTTYWSDFVNTKEEIKNNNYTYLNTYFKRHHYLNNVIHGCYFIKEDDYEWCYSYACITPSVNLNILNCETGERFILLKNENYGFYTFYSFNDYFKIL